MHKYSNYKLTEVVTWWDDNCHAMVSVLIPVIFFYRKNTKFQSHGMEINSATSKLVRREQSNCFSFEKKNGICGHPYSGIFPMATLFTEPVHIDKEFTAAEIESFAQPHFNVIDEHSNRCNFPWCLDLWELLSICQSFNGHIYSRYCVNGVCSNHISYNCSGIMAQTITSNRFSHKDWTNRRNHARKSDDWPTTPIAKEAKFSEITRLDWSSIVLGIINGGVDMPHRKRSATNLLGVIYDAIIHLPDAVSAIHFLCWLIAHSL